MTRRIGFYNGGAGAEYDHGVTVSTDPLAFGAGALVNARSEQQSPTILRDNLVKGAPSPVLVGNEIYVYHDGYMSSAPYVGHVMLDVYNRDGVPRYRTIQPVLSASAVPGAASIARPSVIYEPADALAPFKMVFSYTGTAGTPNTSIGLATSLDGRNWTVLGAAFTTGTGWESAALVTTGRLVNAGGVYHLFYGGYDGTQWKGGVATKSAFSVGGWTKNPNNPILTPRGAFNETIGADITPGSRQVTVASSAAYDIGAPVMLWTPSNPAATEINIVLGHLSGTVIAVANSWLGSYAVASGNKISQVHSRSVDFSEVWYDAADGKWKAIITVFSFNPNANRETTAYAETTDLDQGFDIIPGVWPLPLRPRSVVWDRYSAENLKFVQID